MTTPFAANAAANHDEIAFNQPFVSPINPDEPVCAPPPNTAATTAEAHLADEPQQADHTADNDEWAAKLADLNDALLRARAETENVRRRAQEENLKAHKFAVEKFAKDLLPVVDSLEAALNAGANADDSWKEGVSLTLKQLLAAFERANLQEVNPLGEKFDPHFHQAIATEAAEAAANTVTKVLQKGYTLSSRVLRPALVVVAKPPENAANS